MIFLIRGLLVYQLNNKSGELFNLSKQELDLSILSFPNPCSICSTWILFFNVQQYSIRFYFSGGNMTANFTLLLKAIKSNSENQYPINPFYETVSPYPKTKTKQS